MRRLLVPLAAVSLALIPLALVHPVRVSGRSMEPTFRDSELRWVLRSWVAGTPARGQVWLVDLPGGPALKRVLGLPGETLSQRDGALWAGETLLDEPYLQHPERGSGGPWVAGTGYVLLGDNRPLSHDSRATGPVPRAAFRGRVLH